MKICSFIHPARTFLPCSGVGRHMNGVLLSLARRTDVALSLVFARQWLADNGRLPFNCPLRDLPFKTFATPENLTERCWKLTGFPRMDHAIPSGNDWVYCPMETRLPVSRRPLAVTIHDIKAFEPEHPWATATEQSRFRRRWSYWIHKTIRESRVVFTVSEYSRQRMLTLLNAPADKIVVSGNGIDPRYFNAQATSGRPSRPSVLVVGGLRRQKGAEAVLATARVCRSRGTDVQFDIAGPNDPEWTSQATELGNVNLYGWVNDDALLALMGRASVLLFLSEYEGFGIPAIEALAAGVPAVVANRASLPEVVGDCGYVVEPTATHEIAELVSALASGTIRYDVAKGVTWARQFSWDAVADRVLATLAARS